MAENITPQNPGHSSLGDVPSIESGGVDDRTMASTSFTYAQTPPDEQVDVNGDTEPSKIDYDFGANEVEAAAAREAAAEGLGNVAPDRQANSLSRDEVAAVDVNRPYYVRNEASPYLSKRQAREDVYVTKRRHARLTVFIIVVLIVGTCAGIGWMIWQMIQANAPKEVKQYETVPIERGELLDTIDSMTIVAPVDEVSVTARVSGTVAETFVKDGDLVGEGDALMRLENPTITEALNQAQEALDEAREDVDTQTQRLEAANAELAEAQAAEEAAEEEEEEEDGDDTSDDDDTSSSSSSSSQDKEREKAELMSKVEEAQAKVDAATAALEAANTNLYSVQATYDNAWAQSENLTVRAPIGGTVSNLAKKKEKQESFRVSTSTKLCIVSDNSRMRVEVEIPATERDRVHEGLEVRMVFPDVLVTKQPEEEAEADEEASEEATPEGEELPAADEEDVEPAAEGDGNEGAKEEEDKSEDEEPGGDPEPLQLKTTITSISNEGETSMAIIVFDRPNDDVRKGVTAETSLVLLSVPDSLIVPLRAVQTSKNGATYLNILLDPTRAIVTKVPVQIVAQNSEQAAVKADNIQAGNAAIINDAGEVDVSEDAEQSPGGNKADDSKAKQGE